jgi:hypothetical protein
MCGAGRGLQGSQVGALLYGKLSIIDEANAIDSLERLYANEHIHNPHPEGRGSLPT